MHLGPTMLRETNTRVQGCHRDRMPFRTPRNPGSTLPLGTPDQQSGHPPSGGTSPPERARGLGNPEVRGVFSALDKSNDIKDTAQLLIFIRGINDKFESTEEFLIMESIKGTTRGVD